MLEQVLERKDIKIGIKITIKTLVAGALIVLAVGLPQLVHLWAGASGGMTWLPMYLPVLLAGCLLGTWWGLGVGILSPITSFIITSLISNPMPALSRLPFMILELAVFALVSGLFSKKIYENPVYAFPAVLVAGLSGRTVFLISVALFGSTTGLSTNLVWTQIQSGMTALFIQAIIVPLIVIGLNKLLKKENRK